MSSPADHTPLKTASKTLPVPIPSSSILLISPTNQVLLLHRVKTASAFSSAHVFPGGALSPAHDGPLPSITATDPNLRAYQLAAIRETFEESGILLARSTKTGKLFTDISDAEREEGRRAVHAGEVLFPDLLRKWGCEADVDALVPFTRWVTPGNVRKRFTTQMYLYFLPLGSATPTNSKEKGEGTAVGIFETADLDAEADIVIPHPTHDGGIEHTAARFLPPNKWLSLAEQNRIILFPPQYFLTWHLSHYLSPTVTSASSPIPSPTSLQQERNRLMEFLRGDDGAFGKAIISPMVLGGAYGGEEQGSVGRVRLEKGTAVLRLDYAGPELEREGVRGSMKKWVVTTKFKKEGPRDVRVWERGEILGEEKAERTKL